MIDGDRCLSVEIINLCVNFCVQYLFMLFNCCFNISDVGDAQFVKAGFIS